MNYRDQELLRLQTSLNEAQDFVEKARFPISPSLAESVERARVLCDEMDRRAFTPQDLEQAQLAFVSLQSEVSKSRTAEVQREARYQSHLRDLREQVDIAEAVSDQILEALLPKLRSLRDRAYALLKAEAGSDASLVEEEAKELVVSMRKLSSRAVGSRRASFWHFSFGTRIAVILSIFFLFWLFGKLYLMQEQSRVRRELLIRERMSSH